MLFVIGVFNVLESKHISFFHSFLDYKYHEGVNNLGFIIGKTLSPDLALQAKPALANCQIGHQFERRHLTPFLFVDYSGYLGMTKDQAEKLGADSTLMTQVIKICADYLSYSWFIRANVMRIPLNPPLAEDHIEGAGDHLHQKFRIRFIFGLHITHSMDAPSHFCNFV
ncbi:hypothetical protein [Echinicola strongylocentroti]|uniref:hypothetical protein n=1 Tax=Echinicola strongylocentroti TaxID=1795355 RepID=UPI0013A6D0F7|nr:hypothetical protein [Echinicola strongylocentroti]